MSLAVNAASPLLPQAAAATNQPPSTPVSPLGDPLANEQTFLKLLVSQLQNQDPLNPTDSNQFVSQLTSYSQLEQLIGIRQNTAPADAAATGTNTETTAV
jgi:flagellar basal-body rod modification protein FlgD